VAPAYKQNMLKVDPINGFIGSRAASTGRCTVKKGGTSADSGGDYQRPFEGGKGITYEVHHR
jgi:hypothetical protein